MALAGIGDAIITNIISLMIEKITSSDFVTYARSKRVFKDFNNLNLTLPKLQALLRDAEEKRITSSAVEIWLQDLKELVLDIEDVVDEFSYEMLKRRILGKSSTKVSSFVPKKFLSTTNLFHVTFNLEIGPKMKKINGRLQDLLQQRDYLGLREMISTGVEAERTVKKIYQRLPSTSLVDESRIYGRDTDKEAIVELLLEAGDGVDDIDLVSVIPIVGMGGVGKTTLAQLVYNDDTVVQSFDFRAWVCVSEDFDAIRITKTILQSVGGESYGLNDLNSLQVQLKKRLMGKRILIVLDDVWSEDYNVWTVTRKPFESGMIGSKILVTTRNEGVAAVMRSVPTHFLNVLKDEDCLCLFVQHALGRRDFGYHPELKKIGEEIVKRCQGLPLAAKTLGGLLRTKPHYDDWEKVLVSKIWDLPEEKSGILPALKLSYNYLPSHLKQCFAYCAIFPKDYELNKEELVLLWMAEGFLPQPKENTEMEDFGHQYFDELLSRSFFQRSKNTKQPKFTIHDLLHDLAMFVGGDKCLVLNDRVLNGFSEKARHVSFTRHTYEVLLRFEDLHKIKSLRTLIALPIHTSYLAACCHLSNTMLFDMLPQFKRLRVLSLSGYCIIELPNSIGGLEHLRCINMSYTKIKHLPESICSLFNLQSLLLEGCGDLVKLPQSIGNLVNLHCLDITDTQSLKEMPPGIGNLKSLRILPKFVVKKGDGFGLRELRGLYLRGKLSLFGLQNISDLRDARDASLKEKLELDELELEWDKNSVNEECERVLDSLQPTKNLKRLKISFYGGKTFPPWIGDHTFSKISRISIYKCKSTTLPSLGRLPLLKQAFIDGMDKVERVGYEFLGFGFNGSKPFPSLETLWLQNMSNWEEWVWSSRVDEEEFPCLYELVIRNCPNLTGKLPICLPSLEKLVISQCPKLRDPFVSLPSLHELHIEHCSGLISKGKVDLPSLTTLKIRSMYGITSLSESFPWLQTPLKLLAISGCNELKFLWDGLQKFALPEHLIIEDCSQLDSLADHGKNLSECANDLKFLDYDDMAKQDSLLALKYLQIESCPKLVFFAAIDIFLAIKHLVLKKCSSVQFLPSGLMLNFKYKNSLLEDLEIEDCQFLKSFPEGRLPNTLKSLKIRYCKKLVSLPGGILDADDSRLENLEIIGCSSLRSFPEGKLPITLKVLRIWDCPDLGPLSEKLLQPAMSLKNISIWNYKNLEWLPESRDSFIHLTELNLNDCLRLKSFPESGLHLPNLKSMYIYNCPDLNFLSVKMQNITSLQDLTICKCPNFVSFPKWGLPPNLTSLEIWDCEGFMKLEFDLHHLTSLRDLSIAGGCFEDIFSFPDQNFVLPSNLVSIWISRLGNLESLSAGLRDLKSLEDLEIVNCPKLKSLPKEGLPATLGRLGINDCPVLGKKLSMEKGEYWSLIAHIPCIDIEESDTMLELR